MINRRNIVVGLDIGTSAVKVALGEISHLQVLQVIGVVEVPSLGVRKGNIVDIDRAARAIEAALNDLERLTGMEIMSAIAGFSSVSISALNSHAVIAVGSSNFEIGREDIEKLLYSAGNLALSPDQTVLQVIERQYVVDGYEGVQDPLGMIGNRLEGEILTIVAATAAVQNLRRSTQRINLQIDQLIYNQIMAAEAVLLPAEKEMGVVLVDMGAGTTEISLFQQGSILNTTVLPIGGDYITKDLAIILKTSLEEAKRVKENYGLASPQMVSHDIIVNVGNLQGNQSREISQRLVAEIISARVLDMLEMICLEIEKMTAWDNLAGGVVFTGGGSQLNGIMELMESYMDLPVRLGRSDNINGLKAEYNGPQYTVVLGGLLYAFHHRQPVMVESKAGVTSVFSRINYWLKDLFA